jgi:hypothetical protein
MINIIFLLVTGFISGYLTGYVIAGEKENKTKSKGDYYEN